MCSYIDNSSSSSSSSSSVPSESNPSEGIIEGEAPFHPLPGPRVLKVLEIDYSLKIANIVDMTNEEFDNLSEEEATNSIEYLKNHTTNPVWYDNSKVFSENSIPIYLYTKEQIDIINKNSIIQLEYGEITKFNDNVVIDIVDIGEALNDIQRGQYYCIVTKKHYTQPGR